METSNSAKGAAAGTVISPGVGTVIGAGLGLVGDLFSASSSRKASKEQRDWEERMSNTSYQRQVKDLAAAGLNPMLGYMKGSGASTPSSPPAQVPDFQGASRGAMAGIQAAQQSAMTNASVANLQSQARLNNASAFNIEATHPYSAGTAAANYEGLISQTRQKFNESEISRYDKYIRERDFKELQPLQIEYQNFINQAAKFGLSEKEADAKFWSTVGEAGKWGPALRFLFQLIKK